MKVKMTHNEYLEFMKANANRLYAEKGYTMADYNRDCDSVEVQPYDLGRFGLDFSEEQLRVINSYFTEERVNQRGHMLLEGHVISDGAEFRVADRLGIDIVADKGFSGFGKSDENKCVFEFCEGDIYLVLCETLKEYHEELESHCKHYGVEDRLPELVFVDNRKGAYLHGWDDPGYDEYDVASASGDVLAPDGVDSSSEEVKVVCCGDVDVPFDCPELYNQGLGSIATAGEHLISARLKTVPDFKDVSVSCFDKYDNGYGFWFSFSTSVPVDVSNRLLAEVLAEFNFEVSYELDGASLEDTLEAACKRSEQQYSSNDSAVRKQDDFLLT